MQDSGTAAAVPRSVTRPSRINAIIDAGIEVFGSKGFASASLEEIAELSGVSLSAIYYHFQSRDELLSAAFARVRDEMADITGMWNAPTKGSLFEIVSAIFSWAREHPARARLLWLYSVGATPAMAVEWEAFIADHVRGASRWRDPSDGDDDERHDMAARTAVMSSYLVALNWISGDMPGADDPVRVAAIVTRLVDRIIRTKFETRIDGGVPVESPATERAIRLNDSLPSPVSDFLAAVEARDVEALAAVLADDGRYAFTAPYPVVEGSAAIVAMFVGLFDTADHISWDISSVSVGESGQTVWTERTERFSLQGVEVSIESVGIFRLRDGLIEDVRDYCNLEVLRARLAAADVPLDLSFRLGLAR